MLIRSDEINPIVLEEDDLLLFDEELFVHLIDNEALTIVILNFSLLND